MDLEEARAAYPEIYAGFHALEWARDGGKRHPSIMQTSTYRNGAWEAVQSFYWHGDDASIPQAVRDELPVLQMWPTWTEAMQALVKAARSAYAKGWRP